MNNTLKNPLPVINENSFSITSFLFYFFYFLIFIILSFCIIAYFYPDSIFRKIYNYFLLEFTNSPEKLSDEIQLSNNVQEKEITENIQENKTPDNNTTTNTTQEIKLPNNQKISLDEAVDQYMVLQNQTNSELGKVNYLPPKQYTNKQGWCLVGNDRGYNSCIKVGRNDYCMSGDIYPTKDICINPNLRL